MQPAAPLETARCVEPLFAALEEHGARYAVWKDLDEVEDFGRGDGELDLLVHRADRETFRRLAALHGYAEFRHHIDIYGGQVAHFLRFDAGRTSHLHVHCSLLTGDHTAKEYCLDALFADDLLFGGPLHGGIRTVDAAVEMAIGLVRLVLKAASPSGVKAAELARLRAVYSPDLFAAAVAVIAKGIELRPPTVDLLRGSLEGEGPAPRGLAGHVGTFAALRRLSPSAARFSKMALRGVDGLAWRMGLANKVLTTAAPSLAILGVDGSGKTSIAGALQDSLRRKVSVKRFYLGGNTGTYTPGTWVTYLLHRASSLASRLLPRSSLLRDLRAVFLAVHELSKCRDRVRRIRAAGRTARRGVIIVFERYPIRRLFDVPRLALELEKGEVELRPLAERLVRSLLLRVDRLLAAAGRADITVMIAADYELISSRRALHELERQDIRGKLDTWEEFRRCDAPQPIVIENAGPLEDALAEVFELLRQRLCSLSS